MSSAWTIRPPGPVRGTIRPPGSKSITNRALVCAALARGTSQLAGALDSEDTQVMIAALEQLGVRTRWQPEGVLEVESPGPQGWRLPQQEPRELFVANSGTTIRFLTAMLTVAPRGRFRLDGIPRMRKRPIGHLALALNQLGAQVRTQEGFPPVEVIASGLPGGEATVQGNISSQFLSGLLMAAPAAQGQVTLRVQGELVSRPYVEMTLRVMEQFGVSVQREGLSRFVIPPQSYRPGHYQVEPDASAASYFFAAAAVTGGRVTVEGLGRDSLQGDVRFVDLLERMGCRVRWEPQRVSVSGGPLRGIRADMNPISDTVPTLAAVALFARGTTTITGVEHIRHKETDRIAAVAAELRKLGAAVEELPDGLRITPPTEPRPAQVATYNDHRMAMSFAVAALCIPGVQILDPGCVEKTYPRFFQDLERLLGV